MSSAYMGDGGLEAIASETRPDGASHAAEKALRGDGGGVQLYDISLLHKGQTPALIPTAAVQHNGADTCTIFLGVLQHPQGTPAAQPPLGRLGRHRQLHGDAVGQRCSHPGEQFVLQCQDPTRWCCFRALQDNPTSPVRPQATRLLGGPLPPASSSQSQPRPPTQLLTLPHPVSPMTVAWGRA